MTSFKTFALAAVLSLSTAGLAIAADGGIGALSSANSISFETVTGPEVMLVNSGAGMYDQVDLDSLKARIQQNPGFLAQLASYGATIDDVLGIFASNETDVKIYVQG